MTCHPGAELIAEYAQGGLSGRDRMDVETHLSGCRDCAWLAHRYGIESRGLSEILRRPPPAALADRILLDVTPKARGRSFVPWAAAAALISLALAIVTLRDANRERAKTRELERRVAGKMEDEEKSAFKVLQALCRVEVERNIAEIAVRAGLSDRSLSPLRATLLSATSTSAEAFKRAAMGELDMDELLGTDTLSGLDLALRGSLDRQEYERVSSRLADLGRESAERTIDEFLRDLRTTVGLAEDQIKELRKVLVDRSAWRRDLAFLPEFARRHYFVHVLRDEDNLRPEMLARLSENQSNQVLGFLEREGKGYHKMWEHLKEKS